MEFQSEHAPALSAASTARGTRRHPAVIVHHTASCANYGLTLLLILFASAASAQTWQTVDDFQYAPDETANQGLTVSLSGVIYGCGYGYDASGVPHALVTASADDGTTWSAPLDDFINGDGYFTYYNGITCDRSGNVYGVGYYFLASGAAPNHWFVRRSLDGGVTWSTTDDYVPGGSSWWTEANAVTADAAGNVYVGGLSDTDGWLVRKGTGGANFVTVDAVRTTMVQGGVRALYVHPAAGVFAAGVGPISTSKGTTTYGWLVRRSTNGGVTWSSVDAFSLSSGSKFSGAYGIGADALGNLYVVGRADAVSGAGKSQTVVSHWIVRKSGNGGNSWTTVDDYVGAQAHAFGADSNGNLFVTGTSSAGWTVRESAGGSGAWQTVDTVAGFGGAGAASLAVDTLGHVFAGGYIGNDWVIRKR
jgi:hypothetical protein